MSRTTILAGLVAAGSCALGGCSSPIYLGGTTTARAGESTYGLGVLQTTDRVPIGRAWQATKAATAHMGFLVVGEETDRNGATLTARNPEDHKIVIALQPHTDAETMISVHVGLGQRELCSEVLREIRRHY
jgi:hypothetical protein